MRILARHPIFEPTALQVEGGLEVRLTDQGRAITTDVVQMSRDRGRVRWQWHAIRDHPMRANILAGDHSGTRRHAYYILTVGAQIVDSAGGQCVGHRRSSDLPAVASERIETLLVGR